MYIQSYKSKGHIYYRLRDRKNLIYLGDAQRIYEMKEIYDKVQYALHKHDLSNENNR